MQGADELAVAARYRHPTASPWRRIVESLVASPRWTSLRRWIAARLPMPVLASDVTGVAYMTWWVETARLPAPPQGYRYWVRDGRTPFTILTYRHGGFGPALLGPLRRWLPSPLQSNWRWYMQRYGEPADAVPTVLFARNVMDSLMHVVGARLLSDAMQPQLAARFEHRHDAGRWRTSIEPGQGGAPRLHAELRELDAVQADEAWTRGCFASRAEAWRFLACQDAAVAVAPDGAVALTRIDLPVDPACLQPLSLVAGTIECPMLAAMGADPRAALCFMLPAVPFRVVSEHLL